MSQYREKLSLNLLKALLIFIYEALCGYFMSIVDCFTKKPKSMVGKIVVITGGAGGIGKEIAQMFSNIGAKVVLLDINEALNELAAKEINENAGFAVAYTADVTRPEQLREVASKIQKNPKLGDPDLVICNAGILLPKSTLELSEDDIRKTLDINLLGYFWTIRAFLPRMIENNRGHIAAVCSIAGYFGNTNGSVYSASKFGVRGLMESLEWELYDAGKRNIKMTTIYPFFTKTPLINECNIRSRVFHLLTVEETATSIVEAILYEKVEAYTSSGMSFLCNALKSTAPQRVKVACKHLIDIHYK